MIRRVYFLLAAGGVLLAQAAAAQQSDRAASAMSPAVERAYQAILAAPAVKKALAAIEADDAATFAEQRKITEIASPPYKEMVRAQYYLRRVKELGLADAAIDTEGNVIGVRKGKGGGPKLVISAHLDTVFAEGTDVTVKEKDGRFYAPGIADDTRGLVALLAVIRALNDAGIKTIGDVVFVGTVGEEELGNLRGVKAFFRDHKDIDGFISIDGVRVRRIVNKATGSHRYEMIFKGPGGHSFQAFGLPSAIHAMGRAIAKIGDLEAPSQPKTTFTVGTVGGGTSVNAIAGEARMAVDMRSDSMDELLKLEQRVLAIVQEAAAEENKRWNSDKITAESRLIGDRPAGAIADDATIVQAVRRSLTALGETVETIGGASTDSNTAISLGIPAVTIGGGGESEGTHSLGEWYKPTRAYVGPQNALLIVLGLVGVEGVSEPLLDKRATR